MKEKVLYIGISCMIVLFIGDEVMDYRTTEKLDQLQEQQHTWQAEKDSLNLLYEELQCRIEEREAELQQRQARTDTVYLRQTQADRHYEKIRLAADTASFMDDLRVLAGD